MSSKTTLFVLLTHDAERKMGLCRALGAALRQALHLRERQQRKVIAVHRVCEVEHVGKAGAGGSPFGPFTLRRLQPQEVFHALPELRRLAVAAGAQPEQRPCRLRSRT